MSFSLPTGTLIGSGRIRILKATWNAAMAALAAELNLKEYSTEVKGAGYGGTGINSSSETGYPYVEAGTWKVQTPAEARNGIGAFTAAVANNDLRLIRSGTTLTLQRVTGSDMNIDGSARTVDPLPTLAAPTLTDVDIASLDRSSAMTVGWTNHGLIVGQSVSFKNIAQAEWSVLNGVTYKVLAVLTASTFTVDFDASGFAADYVNTDPGVVTASLPQYVYAYWDGATVQLECSTTGYTVDSTTGRPEQTGDTSRRLVGMSVSDGTGWSTNELLTISYEHRLQKESLRTLTAARAKSSASWTELHPEIRIPFLTWGEEKVQFSVCGGVYGTEAASTTGFLGVGLDGIGTLASGYVTATIRSTANGGGDSVPIGLTAFATPTVGFHTATIGVLVSPASVQNFVMNANTQLHVSLRG